MSTKVVLAIALIIFKPVDVLSAKMVQHKDFTRWMPVLVTAGIWAWSGAGQEAAPRIIL